MRTPRCALLLGVIALQVMATAGCTCGGAGLTTKYGEIGVVSPSVDGPVISRKATYDFGAVLVGESRPLTMVVRNLGAGRLSLVRLTPIDGDPVVFGPASVPGAPFTVDFSPATLEASGLEAQYSMWFSPLVPQKKFAATLELFAEGTPEGEATAMILLLGESQPGSCFVPSEIDFGVVPVGETFSTDLTLTNSASVAAAAFIGAIDGTDALSFGLTTASSGEVTLEPTQSASLRFAFSPTERRAYLAHIQLKGPGPCSVVDVALKGVGGDDVLSWRPPELDFGYVPLEAAVTREVVFVNPSKVTLTLTEVRASVAPFSVDSSTFAVPGGGVLGLLRVTCKPTQLGVVQGALTFSTGLKRLPTGLVKLRCNGGGPKIRVTPSALQLGAMPYFPGAPTPFMTRTLRVANVGSKPQTVAGNLFLGSVTAAGGYGVPPLLEVKPSPGTQPEEWVVEIDPTYNKELKGISPTVGENFIELKVTLVPKSLGVKTGELRIFSNDSSQPVVTVPLSGEAIELPACNYQVTPTPLEFGVLTEATVEKTVTITNLGTTPEQTCRISHLSLTPLTNAAYSLVGPIPDEKTLGPQESWVVTVRVGPVDPSNDTLVDLTGELTFEVPSPTRPRASVKLSANVGPTCLVANSPIDFGTVKVGCNSEARTVTLYNSCFTPVGITGFELLSGGPEFTFAQLPTVPADGLVIQPGASVSFQVKYRPDATGADEGLISIPARHRYNVMARHLLRLKGEGSATGSTSDVFTQDPHPKVDVLVVIDDSGSMADKQMSLQMNFAAFLSVAGLASADYHVGITTTTITNNWCLPDGTSCIMGGSKAPAGILYRDAEVGPILTSTTPDVDAKFALMVSRLGTKGASHEKGLDTAVKALTPPRSMIENVGFLRDDAALAIIVVTDAGDESDLALGYYLDRLRNLKGRRSSFLTFHNIGPYNQPLPACVYDGSGEVSRYKYLADQTGGTTDEICTADWAAALERIGRTVFTFPKRFTLSGNPNLGSGTPVEVLIDGQPLAASDWSYDPASNSVSLIAAAQPGVGQTLTVRYTPACF